MKTNHFGKLKKVGDKLIPANAKDEAIFNIFKNSLDEGAIVDFFAEEVHDNGSLSQLAYAHVLLKQISIDSGNTVEDLKLYIKKKVGLCVTRTIKGEEFVICKSLGDCGADELSLFIQGCLDLQSSI